MRGKRSFVEKTFISLIVLSVLAFVFVIAAPSAPTGLTFTDNETPLYDRNGGFYLNWTSGGGDSESNFTIYLSVDGTQYLEAQNTTALSYTFSNTTNGNYSFIVEAWNATGNRANSSTAYMTVDSIASVFSVTAPTNTTYTNATINLNVTEDGTAANWWYSLNAGITNVSFTPNSTFTASEGQNNITIWANDSAGNEQNSTILYFTVDTTAPSFTVVSPTNATYTSTSVSLSVTGDGTESFWWYSLNGGSNTSFTPNTTITVSEGQNNIVVYVNDSTGNTGNSTLLYFTVNLPEESSSGGSSGSSVATVYLSNSKLATGYTGIITTKTQLRFTIKSVSHLLVLKSITGESVTITVSSTPQTVTMNPGEEKKFDVDDDGRYDISLIFNSKSGSQVSVTLKQIDEVASEVAQNNSAGDTDSQEVDVQESMTADANSSSKTAIIITAIILIIIIAYYFIRKER